jgi:hypothetical protein
MPTIADILLGLALPLILAAIVAAFGRMGRRGDAAGDQDVRPAKGGGRSQHFILTAVTAGYLAGHLGLRGWAGLNPHSASDWLGYLAAGAWGAAMFAAGPRRPRWLIGLAGVVLCAGGAWLLLRSLGPESLLGEAGSTATDEISFDFGDSERWEAGRFFGVVGGLGIAGGVMWAWVSHGSSLARASTGVRPWCLLVVATGCAAVNQLTGSAALGMLGGALAAALGGALLGAWGERWRDFDAAGCIAATVIGGLLVVGHYYSSLPGAWAWLTFATLIPAGGLVTRAWRNGGWRAAGADLALTLAAVAPVVVMAARQFVEDMGDAAW